MKTKVLLTTELQRQEYALRKIYIQILCNSLPLCVSVVKKFAVRNGKRDNRRMTGVHINLDDAWDSSRLSSQGIRTIDARPLGAFLRYTCPPSQLERAFPIFRDGIAEDRFILYGSGDFHYLAAWWMRALIEREPGLKNITLVSFDNHPDWDIRPPKWACGGWLNRVIEIEAVAKASVWGCGNFELAFPGRLFRNRRALASGKMEIHGWAERQTPKVAASFNCMTRDNWRERLEIFARSLAGKRIYITVDLDALACEHAMTNWENGLFTPEEIAWAIGQLKNTGVVIGGDCCGAFSPPAYARRFQRFAAGYDHPRLPAPNLEQARELNHKSLEVIWAALAGRIPT